MLFIFSSSFSQKSSTISGKVIDSRTGIRLAFVNIVYDDKGHGLISGIDGDFKIKNADKIQKLKFSYIGYENKTVQITQKNKNFFLKVRLKRKELQIEEVVVFPGENPAHRIIKKVVENRNINNPEKMQSFSYNSYNKIIFTLDKEKAYIMDSLINKKQDSIKIARYDSLINIGRSGIDIAKIESDIKAKKDSSNNDLGYSSVTDMINNQHIMLMETVTERNFKKPNRNSEIVKASRMSGLKNPAFVLVATQIQSFSFYNELITIFDKMYVNPISKGSTRKYLFVIKDTTFTNAGDTIFAVTFRPRKGKNFQGLKGVLNINTNKYAVQSVIAAPYEEKAMIEIRIQQKYECIDNKQWFPVELNTDIVLKMAEVESEGLSAEFLGIGKSYIKNIKLNPEIENKVVRKADIVVNDDAHKMNEDFWNKHRHDSLTKQDMKTYHVLDSIGEANNLDLKLKLTQTVLNGYIPYYFLNIDYTKILDFNKFEGFRPGIAIITNDRLSKHFSVGGYVAYGFKDKAIKYGGEFNIKPFKKRETNLQFLYKKDVEETGGYDFIDNRNALSSESFRKYLIRDKYYIEEGRVTLTLRPFNPLKVNLYGSVKVINYNKNTLVSPDYNTLNWYNITEAGAELKFSPGEEFMQLPESRISLGSKFPVFWANIAQGIKTLNGEYEYTRINIKVSKVFKSKTFGKTHVQLSGGYVFGETPIFNLFNGHGSYGKFSVEAANSFNTMRMNEFASDRFASVFLSRRDKSVRWEFKANIYNETPFSEPAGNQSRTVRFGQPPQASFA